MEIKTTNIDVVLTLTESILGTVPKDPVVYKTFIESKKPEGLEGEDEYLTVEKMEEKGWTGFHMDDKGLFLYNYMVKGFLKYAGNVLKDAIKVKNLKKKIDDYVFVYPRRLYFEKNNPDGILERPIRGMTARGERVFLGRSDSVETGTKIHLQLEILPHSEIDPDLVLTLLSFYGKRKGLGQWRNGGYGTFETEVTE